MHSVTNLAITQWKQEHWTLYSTSLNQYSKVVILRKLSRQTFLACTHSVKSLTETLIYLLLYFGMCDWVFIVMRKSSLIKNTVLYNGLESISFSVGTFCLPQLFYIIFSYSIIALHFFVAQTISFFSLVWKLIHL